MQKLLFIYFSCITYVHDKRPKSHSSSFSSSLQIYQFIFRAFIDEALVFVIDVILFLVAHGRFETNLAEYILHSLIYFTTRFYLFDFIHSCVLSLVIRAADFCESNLLCLCVFWCLLLHFQWSQLMLKRTLFSLIRVQTVVTNDRSSQVRFWTKQHELGVD